MTARWLAYKIAFDQHIGGDRTKASYWQDCLFLTREQLSLDERRLFADKLMESFQREHAA